MEFLKKMNLNPLLLAKLVGIGIVGILLLIFAFNLIAASFGPLMNRGFTSAIAPSAMPVEYSGYGGGGVAYDSNATKEMDLSMAQLSARNVASTRPPSVHGTTGKTAEQFEVTQYNASIETRHLSDTCNNVLSLKARTDVIFENANTYEHGCSYTFKVEHASVEAVLALIKKLNPKELTENTYTIKSQIEDYTNQIQILEKKRASIEATLISALSAYDGITALATRTENANALAQIIDSRIGIIERLTQERININEQLDNLARAKADQLDRLDYTYFGVNVYENKFVDGQQLKDSWKAAIQDFVRNVNKVVQDLTINLILLLLFIAQWLLYAAIVLVVAKYSWKFATYIWKK